MFDCGGKRETPTTLEDTLNKYEIMPNMQQNDLDEIYAKYDLLCFQLIETKIKSVISEIDAENLITFITMISYENYISIIDLNQITKLLSDTEKKNKIFDILLLPFFILAKKDEIITEAMSYKNYLNFNMKLIVMKELEIFSFENFYNAQENNEDAANPSYNLTNIKNLNKIDVLSITLFFLFFTTTISSPRKASILFDILDTEKSGILKTGKKNFYLIFRKMILIALFTADIVLNQEISCTKKEFLIEVDKMLFNNKTETDSGKEETAELSSDNTMIFQSYTSLIFEYKKILLFIKHTRNIMKNLTTFISHSFVFFDDKTAPQIDKETFLENCKKKNYSIFNPVYYRNYLVQFLFHYSKSSKKFLNNFPVITHQIEKVINVSTIKRTNVESAVISVCRLSEFDDYEKIFLGGLPGIKAIMNTNEYQTKNQLNELNKGNKKKIKTFANRELDQDIIEFGNVKRQQEEDEEDKIVSSMKFEEVEDNNFGGEVLVEEKSKHEEEKQIEDDEGYGGDSENDIIENVQFSYDTDKNKKENNNSHVGSIVVNTNTIKKKYIEDNIDNFEENENERDIVRNIEKEIEQEKKEEEEKGRDNKQIEKDKRTIGEIIAKPNVKESEKGFDKKISEIDLLREMEKEKANEKPKYIKDISIQEDEKEERQSKIENKEDFDIEKDQVNQEEIEDIQKDNQEKENKEEELKCPFIEQNKESNHDEEVKNNNDNNNINLKDINDDFDIIPQSRHINPRSPRANFNVISHKNSKNFSNMNDNDDDLFKLNILQSKELTKPLDDLELGNIPKESDSSVGSEDYNLKDVANQINIKQQQQSNSQRLSVSISPIIVTDSPFFKLGSKKGNQSNLFGEFIASNSAFDSSQLQPTMFLIDYFSELDTYASIPFDTIEQSLKSLSSSTINKIVINKFTPYLSSYSSKDVFNVLTSAMNEQMINMYYTIMSYYNIFLRNSDMTNVKSIFLDTNFFNTLLECHNGSFDKVLMVYSDDIFVGNNKLVFDMVEYIIGVPIFVDKSNLFLAVINNRNKTVTYLDSNDIMNDDPDLMDKFTKIFEEFFSFLNEKKIAKKDLSGWNFDIDSIEAICYNERYAKHIMVYYSKMICQNGKIKTINENEYQVIREIIFKELAMFFVKLGIFVKGNK